MTGRDSVTHARTVWCAFCWADPGTACTALDGQHFARYLRAYRRKVISRDAMIAVCLAVPQISYGRVVPDAAMRDSTDSAPPGRQDERAQRPVADPRPRPSRLG
jgi:hypothetical protein